MIFQDNEGCDAHHDGLLLAITLGDESGLLHVCHLCVSVNEYADGEKPEYHQRKGDEKTHMQRAYVYHGFIIAHDIPNGDYK